MIDKSTEFYEKQLVDIEQKMKWCRQDIEDGIDYDYSQDQLNELDTLREETRLDLACHIRRHSMR